MRGRRDKSGRMPLLVLIPLGAASLVISFIMLGGLYVAITGGGRSSVTTMRATMK